MGASLRVPEDGADSADLALLELEAALAKLPTHRRRPAEGFDVFRLRLTKAASAMLGELRADLKSHERPPETRHDRLLPRFESFSDMMTRLQTALRGIHPSGFPVSLSGRRIVTHTRHALQTQLWQTPEELTSYEASIAAYKDAPIEVPGPNPLLGPNPVTWKEVNVFFSKTKQRWAHVMQSQASNKAVLRMGRAPNWALRMKLDEATMWSAGLASLATAESTARKRLREILDNYDLNDQTAIDRTPYRFHMYMMTGQFEIPGRSKTIYRIRRLRPTIALTRTRKAADGTVLRQARYLGSLCTHPVGYYAYTYSGVLCPTDDVIAHTLLVLGDERRFWSKSYQHAMHEPEAGVG